MNEVKSNEFSKQIAELTMASEISLKEVLTLKKYLEIEENLTSELKKIF